MAIVPIKIVRLLANNRRFIMVSEDKVKVRTKGEVLRYAGCSATHGPDRLFLKSHVEITEVDLSEQLLKELLEQEQA